MITMPFFFNQTAALTGKRLRRLFLVALLAASILLPAGFSAPAHAATASNTEIEQGIQQECRDALEQYFFNSKRTINNSVCADTSNLAQLRTKAQRDCSDHEGINSAPWNNRLCAVTIGGKYVRIALASSPKNESAFNNAISTAVQKNVDDYNSDGTQASSGPIGDNAEVDPVREHCVKKLPKSADSACSDKTIITYARNAASWKCDDSPDPETCVVTQAKKFIDEAAARKNATKSAGNFKKALIDVLKDAVGNKYKKANNLDDGRDYSDPAANIRCSYQGGCDFVAKYIEPAIALFTVAFGLIAVISIILGGIQYASSTGDPQKIAKAKQRIVNTIIAIVCYFFLFGFLQFIIPGGIFN